MNPYTYIYTYYSIYEYDQEHPIAYSFMAICIIIFIVYPLLTLVLSMLHYFYQSQFQWEAVVHFGRVTSLQQGQHRDDQSFPSMGKSSRLT